MRRCWWKSSARAWSMPAPMTSVAARSRPCSRCRRCNSPRASPAVRKIPIKFARLAIERTGLQRAAVDAHDRHDLGIVAGGKNLVRAFEIGVAQARLHHGHAGVAQELDRALACDAVEERAVRLRRIDDAVAAQKDVGGGKLGDIAEHVAYDAVG